MSIIEYFNFQEKYEALYGERTVVLYQLGAFYETYEYDPNNTKEEKYKIDKDGKIWNKHIGHSIILSTTLNYNVGCENGNEPYGIKNCSKLGFPMIALEKCVATLLANDYVVVRVDQRGTGKNITRLVAEICSPTMQLDTISLTRSTSNVICIYIEYQKGTIGKYENFLITTGVSVIDIITGQNKVCEFHSKIDDQVYAIQELYRFLVSHSPRELIIHVADMPSGLDTNSEEHPNPYLKYLERVLELRRFDRLNTYINSIPSEYKKISFQMEFLNKIFTKNAKHSRLDGQESIFTRNVKNNGIKLEDFCKQNGSNKGLTLNIIQKRNEKIIEELGLERMSYGTISYMLLLQHCKTYNKDIINELSKPDLQWLDQNRHLILTHNAIIQLDLIPQKENKYRRKAEIDSLLSVLDENRTPLGKRCLENLLQNPMLDCDEITKYYDMVDEMSIMVDKEFLWQNLDRQLKELPDIGRLQRKLEIKQINPRELAILYRSYLKIVNIYITIIGTKTPVLHSQLFLQDEIAEFNNFLSRFGSMIDFDFLECSHFDSGEAESKWLEFIDCPIKPGFYPDLDIQSLNLVTSENDLQKIVDHFNMFLEKSKGKKIEFRAGKRKQGAQKQDPSKLVLLTTNAKAALLANSDIDKDLCGIIQISSHNTTEKMISSDKIATLCSNIDNIKMSMRTYLLTIYEGILEEMTSKYNFFVSVANLIAKIDLIHCYALISYRYNYYRPEIVNDQGPSFLEAKDLRHAIIERINTSPYVANDVFLGRGSEESGRSNGMLIYGINAAGKSSLLKATALCIIMAQIGLFTPARLRYKPYSKIITRLSGNDNIFKGESTFIVEASELRTIERQSDLSTLTIMDEVARGTESQSSSAITIATIKSEIRHQSSFMLSTHMHAIVKFPYILQLKKSSLYICHFDLINDEKNNILIYDRKLLPGSGSSIYGLTVIKSLGFSNEFINDANEVLLYLEGSSGNIIESKVSQYNAKLYVSECAICQKTNLQTELQSHHIVHQDKADTRGLIGNFHKNIKDNLIVLCRECHHELHKKGIEFEIVETLNEKIIRIKM